MSQIGDLFARMLSAGGSRGLSRDADLVLAPDPMLAFYNESLRGHAAEGDLVADPALLWDTGSLLGRRGGLRAHLGGARASDVLGVSDVLIVVNRDDWRRSFREVRVPWIERAAQTLRDRFETFCRQEDLHLAFPQRPLGFRIVEDGGAEMRGERIGLSSGEYVTGLLPNLYGGPVAASRRSIAVHLNVPGGWEGYQEVGALFSDQVLFTLGSHWLDNFRNPALEVPALYRLHQYGDGSFIHVINPEVKGRYRIAEVGGAGPQVLRLERDDGHVLAWMVLQIVEEEGPPDALPPRRWTSTLQELGGADDSMPPGAPLFNAAITAGRTVVPEAVDDRLVVIRETGALLQKVHFARFMEGYDVYLDPAGRVVTTADRPAATIHVRGRQISFEAHQGGVGVDGVELSVGAPVFLEGDARITVGDAVVEWRDLGGVKVPGWPYLAELRRTGSTSHLVQGRSHRIGREPRSAIRLPDEPHNDNIVWRPELRAGGTIRSRNGEIPKSRFYIDSIMVASEHAEIDLSAAPTLRSLARDCFTYVRRGDVILPLHPRRKAAGPLEQDLRGGDEILVGNCVFRVGFGADDVAPAPTGPPLSARELAAAADVDVAGTSGPEFALPPPRRVAAPAMVEEEPSTPVRVEEADSNADPFDAPTAAGLGERGAPPPPPRIERIQDSILDEPEAPPAPDLAAGDADPLDAPTALGSLPVYDPLDAPTTPHGARHADPFGIPDGPPPPYDPLDAPTRPSRLDSIDILEAPTRPDAAPPRVRPPVVPTPRVAPPMLLGDRVTDPSEVEDPTRPPDLAPPPVHVPTSGDSILGDRDDPLASEGAGSAVEPDSLPGSRAAPDAARTAAGGVAVVDEAEWQHELSRPARLALVGWMVTGTVIVGNHVGADLVVPENRSVPGQRFSPVDYLELFVRGRRGRFRQLAPGEARVRLGGNVVHEGESVEGLEIGIVRRDDIGEEDFVVELALRADPTLPDPRARLLALDRQDRMAAALFTLGLPRRRARPVQLGPISARATWDGGVLRLEGYLHSYRRAGGGWQPFFVQTGGGAFRTVPEDGAPVELRPGDRLISGSSVYAFEV